MKKNITAFGIILLFASKIFACTNIVIMAKDGAVVNARTMEFALNLKSQIRTSPRGRSFGNQALNVTSNQKWQGKYGFVYLNGFGFDIAVDGMNEKGLSFGALYLPGFTKYADNNEANKQKGISYLQMGFWVLSQFDDVDKVKEAVKNKAVFNQPLDLPAHKNVTFPLHYGITDSRGKSIVIEIIDGQTKIYDNPQGVLTNAPTFDWQLHNLDNYINLTPYTPKPVVINGINYTANGQGAGMLGLPGDISPPSRFVKMAVLKATSFPVGNAKDAVKLSKYIIGNVFIPAGLVREPKDSPLGHYETTQWTVFKDLQNKIFYFTSYDYPTLQAINLNKLDFNNKKSSMFMSVNNPSPLAIDVTDKLSQSNK
jgi:choloylglycine hydrolase